MLKERIAFLGGGVMATAILRSLFTAGLVVPEQVTVSDPSPASREAMKALGVQAVVSNAEAAADADVIVLAVKPQFVCPVLREIAPNLSETQWLVSIAAGVTLLRMEEILDRIAVVRVMPNTPVQVGAGAVAFARGTNATDEHARIVQQIFEAGGVCFEVTEPQLDVVTGLSGSGPAYVCLIIEALADGAVNMGLPRAVSLTLAAQTLLGAAKLVMETGEHPAALKDRVATPGGTTIAGLAALEDAGVRAGLIHAVEAATRRSQELGR